MSLLGYKNSIPCPWGEGLLHLGSGASPSQGHLSLLHKTQHSYPRSGEIQWFNILWWWTTLYQELTKLFGGNFECEHVWQTLKTCDTECFKKACITKMFCTHTRKWMVHTCSIVYVVLFTFSWRFTSAPAASSAFTISVWWFWTANIRAVCPFWGTTETTM